MYTNPLQGHPDAKKLRKEAGRYVRRCREAAGKTQQQVAKSLGMEYYTMVSQVERGKTRVPPEHLEDWARTLGVHPREFASTLLQFYDPFMWRLLFGADNQQ